MVSAILAAAYQLAARKGYRQLLPEPLEKCADFVAAID
jgi:hypothetical protein